MKKIPIAYQGEKGSYSEQAIIQYGKKQKTQFQPVPKKTFRDLFNAIQKETGLGMVPIENSTAGSVVECYDLFLEYNIQIIGEFILPINHCLLAKKGTTKENIKKVYSHSQALMQCEQYITKHKLTSIAVKDTAGAAKKLNEQTNGYEAAIASKIAAQEYDLAIIEENIQTNKKNQTRFLLVKHKDKKIKELNLPKTKDKSTVMFRVAGMPSALYKCLGGFATNNINLLKIESRPSQKKEFDYVFYLDFEGNIDQKPILRALDELNYFSDKLKFLGSYKQHTLK